MPQLELRELRKCDTKKAIQFAITGMHFDWYVKNKVLLNLYGRYFWYSELTRATQVLAAYCGDEFVGGLLCEMNGEKALYHSFYQAVYVKIFDFLQKTFAKEGPGVYEKTTKELAVNYKEKYTPDGEILFLAADPDKKIKGVGSFLLAELERREAGKEVYLQTDHACTYQFYEHRGFEKAGEKEVTLVIGSNKVDLSCFLYHKVLGR